MTAACKILLAIQDESLAFDLSLNLKKNLPKIPLQIDIAGDGSRALYIFREHAPNLVLLTPELPIVDGLSLIREIRKSDGGIGIFVLSAQEVSVSEVGIEQVRIPIDNWTLFADRILSLLPEEIKAKYGIKRKNEKLETLLDDYVRTHIVRPQAEDNKPAGETMALIPTFSEHKADDIVGKQKPAAPLDQGSPPSAGLEPKSYKIYGVELLSLFTLLGVSLFLFYKTKTTAGSDADYYRYAWLFASVLTGVSFFGFFVGKVLEKILWSNPPKI